MRMINTNLLNYFYKKGVKTLKEAVENKLDKSRAANNLYTTEEGFYMDARQGPVIQGQIDDINSNLSELIAKVNVRVRLIAGNIKSNADGTFTFTHNLNFKGGYVCIAGFGGPTTDYVTIGMADENIVYGTIRHTDGTGYAVTTALVFVLIGN